MSNRLVGSLVLWWTCGVLTVVWLAVTGIRLWKHLESSNVAIGSGFRGLLRLWQLVFRGCSKMDIVEHDSRHLWTKVRLAFVAVVIWSVLFQAVRLWN
jgi:hypothetical protein